MALIKCKECGKDISETAENCPHCGDRTAYGHRATEAKLSRVKQIIAVALFLTGLVLIAGNGLQFIALYKEWDDHRPYYEDYYYSFGHYCRHEGGWETLSKTTYGVLFLLVGFSGMYVINPKIKELEGNVSDTEKKTVKATPTSVPEKKPVSASCWRCNECGEINKEHMDRCQYCGSTKKISVSQKK